MSETGRPGEDRVACADCRHFTPTRLVPTGLDGWQMQMGECGLAGTALGLPDKAYPETPSWGSCYLGKRRTRTHG